MVENEALLKFSPEQNRRINDRITSLLKEIWDIAFEQSQRVGNRDPNFIIINAQTVTMQSMLSMIDKTSKAAREYAVHYLEEEKKSQSNKNIIAG